MLPVLPEALVAVVVLALVLPTAVPLEPETAALEPPVEAEVFVPEELAVVAAAVALELPALDVPEVEPRLAEDPELLPEEPAAETATADVDDDPRLFEEELPVDAALAAVAPLAEVAVFEPQATLQAIMASPNTHRIRHPLSLALHLAMRGSPPTMSEGLQARRVRRQMKRPRSSVGERLASPR